MVGSDSCGTSPFLFNSELSVKGSRLCRLPTFGILGCPKRRCTSVTWITWRLTDRYSRWMKGEEREAIMSRLTDEMVKYFRRSSGSSGSGLLAAIRFFWLHNNGVGLPGNKHALTSASSPSDARKQLVKVAQTSRNTLMLPQRWFYSGAARESAHTGTIGTLRPVQPPPTLRKTNSARVSVRQPQTRRNSK